MTVRRLIAIAFIFAGSAVAWFVLGSSVVARTGQYNELSSEVALLWGSAHRLRIVSGAGRRLWPAAAAQTVYLVAFSYAFFFEGVTGLAVTIGAVITLFVLMQTTARVNWGEVFASPANRARSEA